MKEPIFRNLWVLNKSSNTVFQVTEGVSNFSVYRFEVRRHEKHINFNNCNQFRTNKLLNKKFKFIFAVC